jgi:hypothetical protein
MSNDPLKTILEQVVADATAKQSHEAQAKAERERVQADIAAKAAAAAPFFSAAGASARTALDEVRTAFQAAGCKCDLRAAPQLHGIRHFDRTQRYTLRTLWILSTHHPKRQIDTIPPESIISVSEAVPAEDIMLDAKITVDVSWRRPDISRTVDISHSARDVSGATREAISDAVQLIMSWYSGHRPST